jgi:acetyl esterase/lipase
MPLGHLNRSGTELPTVNEAATAVALAAYATWHSPDSDLAAMRHGFDHMLPEPGADVSVTSASVGGVSGRWVQVPESGEATVLYLHGGGGLLGSSYGYRDLGSRIARFGRARVFLADYALAPERPFPAGLNDVRAAFSGLVEQLGNRTEKLIMAGDSAGGGMAVALVAALVSEGAPLPAGVVALSPFADMTLSGESMTQLAAVDQISTPAAAEQMSNAYLGGHDPHDPLVSPVFADFTGFPPLLLQVGDCETLLDDALRLAERVSAAGGQVDLQIGEGLFHVYQMFADRVPEAEQALQAVGSFIRAQTS